MMRGVISVMIIAVATAACAAGGWFLYTWIAVDGMGQAPHVMVVLGAIGLVALGLAVLYMTLMSLRDAPPREHRPMADRDPYD